jgi:hypothetical protein
MPLKRRATHRLITYGGGSLPAQFEVFQEAGQEPVWYEGDGLTCFWEPCNNGLRKQCLRVRNYMLIRFNQKEGAWK